MRSRKDDRAASPVIGEVLLIALAIVVTGIIYAATRPEPNERPAAVAMNPHSTSADEWTGMLAAATPGTLWYEVEPMLDGVALVYDPALAADNTWCRIQQEVCAVSPEVAAPMLAGDKIRVHHTDISGRTLEVRDGAANTLLLSMRLR